MNPITELVTGSHYLIRGFGLLPASGLRRYVILPILVNLVLMIGLMAILGWQLSGWLHTWLDSLPDWLAWLEQVLWWLAMALSLLGLSYIFTLTANLIASPFTGMLSARVEYLHSGQAPETGMTLMGEMWDGVASEVKRLGHYLSRAALLGGVSLMLLFIPMAHFAIAPMWFIFGAIMLAFEYLDLPMANRGFAFHRKKRHLYARGWRHLGFGALVTAVALVPIVNLVVVPAAVIGATLLYMETDYASARGHRRSSGNRVPRKAP